VVDSLPLHDRGRVFTRQGYIQWPHHPPRADPLPALPRGRARGRQDRDDPLTLAAELPDEAVDARDTVAHLLGHEMAVHARAIVLQWSAAHLNEPDGVHAMRVSARRLRSILAMGRPFLDRAVTESLRDELAWLTGVLGDARDTEVQSARIQEAIDALVTERADLDWETDHVRPALLAPLQARHEIALHALREALESRRYGELVEGLGSFAAAPPWTSRARKRERGAYRHQVRRHLARLDRRMKAAADPGLDPDARAAALHDARKAVKRTRYAVEPLRPVLGRRAAKLTGRLKALQAELGQLQDTVITRAYLHDLVRSHAPGVDPAVALVAGALIEREATHAEGFEAAALRAWERVASAKPLP
jgi:CHAD domain-containing protein